MDMCLFRRPQMPAPIQQTAGAPPPQPGPATDDPVALAMRARARQREQLRFGRQSTILTRKRLSMDGPVMPGALPVTNAAQQPTLLGS